MRSYKGNAIKNYYAWVLRRALHVVQFITTPLFRVTTCSKLSWLYIKFIINKQGTAFSSLYLQYSSHKHTFGKELQDF